MRIRPKTGTSRDFDDLCVQHKGRTTRISVRVRHSGNDLLVFLHGLGCAKESFDAAFDAPSLRGFSVCAFDFPGHGGSERRPDSDYSLPAHAKVTVDVVRQVRERLRITSGRVVLVGHSMGGAVALLAAPDIPELSQYVSVEGNLVGEDCGLVSRSIADQPAAEFIPAGHRAFREKLACSERADLRAWAEWNADADPEAVHGSARSLVEWSDNGKLLEMLQNLPRPAAYVHGDEDEKPHLLPRLGNTCVVRRVARAGHFLMIDQPDEFYTMLADLIEGPRPVAFRERLRACFEVR